MTVRDRIYRFIIDHRICKYIASAVCNRFNLFNDDYTNIKANLSNLDENLKTVCFVADCYWNTVECTLPVLTYLKEHENCNIIFLAKEKVTYQKAKENIFFKNQIDKVSDVVLYNTSILIQRDSNFGKLKAYIKNIVFYSILEFWLDRIRLDAILSLYSADVFVEELISRHPEAKVVGESHAAFDGSMYYDGDPVECIDADIFFFPDSSLQFFSEKVIKKSVITGAPIYDEWWRKILVDISGVQELSQHLMSFEKKRLLIVMPYLPDVRRCFADEYEELGNFLKEVQDSYTIVFKFHPREMANDIDEFFKKNELQSGDYIISVIPLISLATIMDCVVVVGASTSTSDVLISDIPVIEFHNNSYHIGFFAFGDNQYGTLFRKHDIVPYAATAMDLVKTVEDILFNALWERYEKKYKEYIPANNNACKRVSELLLK